MDKMVINQLPSETLRGNRVFVRLDAASEPSSSSGGTGAGARVADV
jgi:hypothetical protein